MVLMEEIVRLCPAKGGIVIINFMFPAVASRPGSAAIRCSNVAIPPRRTSGGSRWRIDSGQFSVQNSHAFMYYLFARSRMVGYNFFVARDVIIEPCRAVVRRKNIF